MSFHIAIGEATISYELRDPDELDIPSRALVLSVSKGHHPEAPVFPGDSMTGDSNSLHVGYASWHAFVKQAGMEALWLDQEFGILRSHPGVVLLTKAHLDAFLVAQNAAAQTTPRLPPGWCVCAACSPFTTPPGISHTPRDGKSAYLAWLVWWSKWALTHCRIPAIANS